MASIQIKGVILALVWIALLLFIAWPLAMFLYPFHIFLQPFAGIPGGLGRLIKDIVDFLAKFCTWPQVIGEAIFSLSETFPEPRSSGYTMI